MDNNSLDSGDNRAQRVDDYSGNTETIKISTVLSIAMVLIVLAGIIFIGLSVSKSGPKSGDTGNPENSIPGFLFSIYEGKHKLSHPIALSTDKKGRIYVSNNDVHTVEVFSANGKPYSSLGTQGQSAGQFTYPYGVGFLPNGNVLVAETGNYRIQELTADGKYVKIFVDKNNKLGLQKPGPLYIDGQGLVYVGDLSGQQVLVLNQDGTIRRRFSGIQYPHGIAVDQEGKWLFVGDGASNCVDVFSLENSSDRPIKVIKGPDARTNFGMVRGLALEKSGRLLVVDTLKSVIWVFDKSGNCLFYLGQRGQGDGQFLYPYGIASDKSGKIYVADWGNNRVQVWGY